MVRPRPITEKEIEEKKKRNGKNRKTRDEIVRYLVEGNVIEAVRTAQDKWTETFREIIPEKYLRQFVKAVMKKVSDGEYYHQVKFGCGSLFDLAIIAKSISRKINFTESDLENIEEMILVLWGGVYNYNSEEIAD